MFVSTHASTGANKGVRLLFLMFFAMLAFIIGGGIYTFVNAEGFMMMTDKPEACSQCHIMTEVYDSFSKGDHANRASCVDCHLPHDFMGYWSKKAYHGLKHGFFFTLVDNPANLKAADMTHDDVNNSCAYCHSSMAANAINPTFNAHTEQLDCLSCHRGVGHLHN